MLELRERPDSRTTRGNPPAFELKYDAIGSADDQLVYTYARAATPAVYFAAGSLLYRQDVVVEPRGWQCWTCTVPYGLQERPTGSVDFAYDTQGGTVLIRQSKSTTRFPGNAPDHKGAIDVDGDQVRGTEITIPALRLTYDFRHPAGVVNETWARNLARMTGRTNSRPWRGFAAGEALFLGSTGRSGTQSETMTSYHFACSENIDGLTIGAVANIAKKGWEYLWISYQPAVDGGRPVQQPQFVYVEKLYGELDFAAALGF